MEQVIHDYQSLMKWDARKRKQTVIGARLGRLLLTDQRVLFLSTGNNDLTVGKLAAGASGRATASMAVSDTSHLDLAALANDGSLDLPLASVVRADHKGRLFKSLTLTYVVDGKERHASFAPKNGPFFGGDQWVAEFEAARRAVAG